MRLVLAAMAASLIWTTALHADEGRMRYTVTDGSVTIDVIDEGSGKLMVLLPSSGRDSEDYDPVAAGLSDAGFRVLRPQPRGAGASVGPMENLTLHDFAGDVALAIRNADDGPAIVVGHAFGNWVARMTATDHPELVRGVVIAAAAAKDYPKELVVSLRNAGSENLTEEERLEALQTALFAPGNDPSFWLQGWNPAVFASQRQVIANPLEEEWWSAGTTPLLDLQASQDPFRPRSTANDIKDEFGDRVTIMTIDNASHALLPEQPDAVVAAISEWTQTLD